MEAVFTDVQLPKIDILKMMRNFARKKFREKKISCIEEKQSFYIFTELIFAFEKKVRIF